MFGCSGSGFVSVRRTFKVALPMHFFFFSFLQCVVIGLQSTGEASTDAALRTRGQGSSLSAGGGGGADEEKGGAAETTSTDYISAPQQTVIRVIERCFALPPRPRAMREKEKENQKVSFGAGVFFFELVWCSLVCGLWFGVLIAW